MFTAILRASSRVHGHPAAGLILIVDIVQRLSVGVADDETIGPVVDGPWRREAASPFDHGADLCISAAPDADAAGVTPPAMSPLGQHRRFYGDQRRQHIADRCD
jgi:hypothetical protein